MERENKAEGLELAPCDGKEWLIGDIHGCFKTLEHLIGKLDLSSKDRLVFLGDYIDRGPSSSKVLDFLIKLSDQFDCYFLRGNHEEMLLNCLNKGFPAIYQHLERLGGLDLLKSSQIKAEHIAFMQATYHWISSEQRIYVHAGIQANSNWKKHLQEMLWLRDYELPSSFPYQVFHGHQPTPVKECRLAIKANSNRIPLDAGCAFKGVYPNMGHLLAYETSSKTLIEIEKID